MRSFHTKKAFWYVKTTLLLRRRPHFPLSPSTAFSLRDLLYSNSSGGSRNGQHFCVCIFVFFTMKAQRKSRNHELYVCILYIPNIYSISPAAIWQKNETKPWFYDDNTGENIF